MTRNYFEAQLRKGIPADSFLRGENFLQKLREAPTVEQKRALVAERNPYLYAFGEKLEVQHD